MGKYIHTYTNTQVHICAAFSPPIPMVNNPNPFQCFFLIKPLLEAGISFECVYMIVYNFMNFDSCIYL